LQAMANNAAGLGLVARYVAYTAAPGADPAIDDIHYGA
jgi:hypothetical protein